MSDRHDELRESLGAHVLGQLDDETRREVDEHLLTCEECRAEREEIAPLADALRSIDPDRLRPVGVVPPPELDRRILAMLPSAGPRRLRRWAPAVAGLVVGVAASTIFAVSIRSDEPAPAPGPTIIAVDRVETSRGVTASAGLVDHTWGVEIKIDITGLPGGKTYEVDVIGRDGKTYQAGEFIGVAGKTIACNMSSGVLLDDAVRFTVVDRDGQEVMAGDLPPAPA